MTKAKLSGLLSDWAYSILEEDIVKDLLKQCVKRSVVLRRLARRYNVKHLGYSLDWNKILSTDRKYWNAALQAAKNGPHVLLATSNGGFLIAAALDGLLATALTLRGANVHFLLCDELLPACQECDVSWYPNQKQFVRYGPSKNFCKSCFKPANSMYRAFGFPVHRYSEFVSLEDLQTAETISSTLPFADIGKYSMDGIAVGEHALAGALRFYTRATLDGEPYAEPVLRRYLKAALLTTYAMRRLLKTIDFKCAVFHHGIYVPQGVIGEVTRREKVRVVNWVPAYRKRCFIFSHGDTYHHTLMSEPVSKWENIGWTSEMEAELMDYLKSRWRGTKDWIGFHEKPVEDLNLIAHELGVDFSKPCIGMLTNVMWDAQLLYPANAFPNMLEWVLQTIAYFSKRPELQLLIRVHPAEIRGELPSRQRIADEISKAFPTLPNNVIIIPPESRVSTYAVMSQCNAVIIYATKTGVELTNMGIPVIVAGEAWVRNKGITMDASSVEHHFKLLDQLPFKQPLDKTTVQKARKYGYHFFFRRMIPLEFMEPTSGWPPFKIQLSGLQDLLPGRSRGLDIICKGILKGTDFIYPAEQYVKPVK